MMGKNHPKEGSVPVMEITFAQSSHIPGILDLLRQVGQVHHQIRPDLFRPGAQKYDVPALEAILQDSDRPVLVALNEGKVTGYAFCILQRVQDDPVLRDRKNLYIDDLCVDADCRGRGVASALYRQVCAYARDLGCQAVTLNVWCGNDRAMAFYEKCGLKPQKIGMEYILQESGGTYGL